MQATCEAGLGSAESAADGTYYPSVTVGAGNGGCDVPIDYPPDGDNVGWWHFRTTSGGPEVQHEDVDPGHPMHGRMFTFEENDCNVYRTDDDGSWRDAALNDAFQG